MKTISLFRAGEFLVGIESEVLSSVYTVDSGQKADPEGDRAFLHAESLFCQQPVAGPEVDRLIIEIASDVAKEHPPLLMTEQVADCVEMEHPEPLPAYFPETARRCTPRMAAHGEDTVLLLDPEVLYEIWDSAQREDLLVKESAILACIEQETAECETEKTVVPEPDRDQAGSFAGDIERESEAGRYRTANSTEPVAVGDPVRAIIAWIVEEYTARNGAVNFGVEDIPGSLKAKAGLPDSLLDYLLRETLNRCRKKS
jgi:hypothetical protein